MEKIKKSPILMGVLSCVGVAALLLVIDLILSLIKGRTFAEQISDPIQLIILIVGSLGSGISYYFSTKKKLEEKKDK